MPADFDFLPRCRFHHHWLPHIADDILWLRSGDEHQRITLFHILASVMQHRRDRAVNRCA